MPKFPSIEVKLSGEDGNAFAILVRVKRAMRAAGISETDIQDFRYEATLSDYDHLIRTCMQYVNVT